ncbi:MAG TPA: tetratricopeptide repeat protein, partial [Streptosporangiaceae bacterium]|nr:tetratricopeptide repeat protein [Streptosporangiaceae bacterium]
APAAGARVGRRRVVLASSAAVLLVAGAGLVWRATHRAPAPLSRTAIAVLPFAVSGSDSLGLSQGLVSLLSTKLDGAGQLRSVDPRALLSFVGRQKAGSPGPDQGKEIAGHFGAGLFVLGDLLEVAGRLRLNAAVYDATAAPRIVAQGSAEGDAKRIFELVDSLTGQLLAGLGGAQSRLAGIAAVTTQSLPALKAYLEGESAIRAGDFETAFEALQRAVAADSLFALAWYRLSVASEWLLRSETSRDAAEHAARWSSRLSEHDRLLLEAMVGSRRGDAMEAERLYRSITATYPDDLEAWFQLGEVQFHFGPFFGRPAALSRPAWERVLFLEPDNVSAMVHLARLAVSERRPGELDSIVRRVEAVRGPWDGSPAAVRSEALEIGTLRAFVLQDQVAIARAIAALRRSNEVTISVIAWDLSREGGDLDAASRVAALLTEPSRSAPTQGLGHMILAYLDVARGHWKAAQPELQAAAALDPNRALEFGGLLALTPYFPAIPARLSDSLGRLAQQLDLPPDAPTASGGYFTSHNGLHRQLRTYLLGLLQARRGDVAALRAAAELESMRGPGTVMADLAEGIRAELALRQERSAEALRAVERMKFVLSYEPRIFSPFLSVGRERFLRAAVLEQAGRLDEALSWYDSFGENSVFDAIYIGPAHLHHARILERLGRPREAADHYARFTELWQNADPEFQPMVREARERLADLIRR